MPKLSFSIRLLICMWCILFVPTSFSAITMDLKLRFDPSSGNGIANVISGSNRFGDGCDSNLAKEDLWELLSNVNPGPSAGYSIQASLGKSRIVTMRSSEGHQLDLKISPLGFYRESSFGYGSGGQIITGPACTNYANSEHSYVQKLHNEQGTVIYSTYISGTPIFHLYTISEIVDFNNVHPGHYEAYIVFSKDEVSITPNYNYGPQQVHAKVYLDVDHVFNVKFPYKFVSTDPKNLNWSEIPIDVETNENFKIKYYCKPGGNSDYGLNASGFCKVYTNGPALGVQLRFPHMGYKSQLAADTWEDFYADSFKTKDTSMRTRGYIGFKLFDYDKAQPGAVYISRPHFIVEADY